MNTNSVQIGRAIVLSVLFFITSFSLLLGEHGHPLHVVAASLMLIGSMVHVRTKQKWMRATLFRPVNELTPRVRQLRSTALWLIGLSFLCAATGIGQMLAFHGLSVGMLGALHALSGGLMIVVIGVHLVQHWSWLTNAIRQPARVKNEPVIQE